MYFTQRSSIRRRFYAHADVEGAGGGRAATRSGRQVGGYNADSLLRLGKGPIGAGTADRLVESGQADARAKNGQVYLTPSVPKTAAAPRLDLPTPAAARTETETRSTQRASGGRGSPESRKDRNIFSRVGQGVLSGLSQRSADWTGKLGTIMDVQGGTAMRGVYENQSKTLENQIGVLDGIIRDPASTECDKREAEEARRIAQQELGKYNRAVNANRATAGELYKSTDRQQHFSDEMARRSVEGTSGLKRTALSAVPTVTEAALDSGLNRFLPGLDYVAGGAAAMGRSETDYRYRSGDTYDPHIAASKGMNSAAKMIETDLAFRGVGELLKNPALSHQQRNAVQSDIADAEDQYNALLRTLADPNATAAQRAEAAQRTVDAVDYARGRLDDMGFSASRQDVGKAQNTLEDIVQRVKPIAKEDGITSAASLALVPVKAEPPALYSDAMRTMKPETSLPNLEKPATINFDSSFISPSGAREGWVSPAPAEKRRLQHGFEVFPSGDMLKDYVQQVKPKEGYFDVGLHGTSNGVGFGTKAPSMSPRELANVIRHDSEYRGQNIRLLSCDTGKLLASGDYCFAEELANALGVAVEAPNDELFIRSDGSFYIGQVNQGAMEIFMPNQRGRFK